MQENRLILACVVFAIAATGAANLPLKSSNTRANNFVTTPQPSLRQQEQGKEILVGDVFSAHDSLTYKGYVVEKQHKEVREAYPPGTQSPPSRIDVSFAVLKRQGKVLVKFDDNIYFGMGNNTRFGLFSFLGDQTKQLVVSQDIPRGGTQWIVNLLPEPRIIFDGPNWGVGREGDDMGIIDLDHDGVFEIIVQITDFYNFQDKLPIARIPLPEIVFKYDNKALKYVPANTGFESYALRRISDREVATTTDEFDQRSMALHKLLAFIYVGKESQAWEIYNSSYKLSDKEEIRHRVETILIRQPIYKFIYNPRSHK